MFDGKMYTQEHLSDQCSRISYRLMAIRSTDTGDERAKLTKHAKRMVDKAAFEFGDEFVGATLPPYRQGTPVSLFCEQVLCIDCG